MNTKAKIIISEIILLMLFSAIGLLFRLNILFLIIGFIISSITVLLLAIIESTSKPTNPKKYIEYSIEETTEKNDKSKSKDFDYPDEFDHSLEDHDTLEGWCEDCEEHEDDLE